MKHSATSSSDVKVYTSDNMPSVAQQVRNKIEELEAQCSEDAFFLCDVGDIITKFTMWKELIPRAQPFYAAKCNTDRIVLKTLADLGAGFDCASKNEISQILDLGVSPSRVIYANPCKQKSFIKYAAKKNVDLMTFDNEPELIKVKELYPDARLVLRILPTSQVKVQCVLGNKFGCHPDNVVKLLSKAQELNLNVMGISFHVGSGVEEARAFSSAVKQAHDAWHSAVQMGFHMTLLDIGGGFPGQESAPVSFAEIAGVVNEALDTHFPEEMGVQIIAEPGRYFVASAFTLTVNVIAKRTVARDAKETVDVKCNKEGQEIAGNMACDGPPDGFSQQSLTGNDEPSFMYYVNDGVYGSFNSLMYDHATVQASYLDVADPSLSYTSSIWGPTCDGLDCILKEVRLPELEVGQWLFFRDMGAYTMCAGSTFNGMPRPECTYFCNDQLWASVYQEPCPRKKRCISHHGQDYPLMQAGPDMECLREAASCASSRNKVVEEEPVLA